MDYKRYTQEHKQWVLEQMMPPLNRSIAELAQVTGITTVTLRAWRAAARAQGQLVPESGNRRERWSSADKFRMVLQSAPLSDSELSAYCRRKGVYPEQLTQWRHACVQANQMTLEHSPQQQVQRIRELERQVQRQEAELAEAQALLVLQKKCEAIWGKEQNE